MSDEVTADVVHRLRYWETREYAQTDQAMRDGADEIERHRRALGVLAVQILQQDWDAVTSWAKSVSVVFPNGEPEVRS